VEGEAKESTGITRGQNAVHVLPLDWAALARVLAPIVDRVDLARGEPQMLVVTSDAESAAAAADALVGAAGVRDIRVLAVSNSPRAARLLKSSPPHIVVGAPAELVALLRGSALKAESVRAVALAWLDAVIGTPEAEPLETLFGELPKEGARVIFAAELTPAYEALIERYARRARREVEPAAEAEVPLTAEYVASTPAGRAAALRRLLDALDLPQAVLYARDERARSDATRVARALGYPRDAVRVVSEAAAAGRAEPLVLLDLPASRSEMRALAGNEGRTLYAVVQPSQLDSLRALLGGGSVSPIALVDAAERARGKDAALRAALREVLTAGEVRREVLALEPLLEEFDGIEIAAAALRLLEQQRPARPAAVVAQRPPMTTLFVNVGERDGVRPQELATAVTTSAGLPSSQVGKIEVRDTHSLVEVAASVAELAAGKLTGSVIRGRRVQARVDRPREGRPHGAPARGERGDRGDRGERGDRPARSGPPRGAPRGDRSERPARSFDRGAKKPYDRAGGERRPPRAAGPSRPRRDDA
jgi:ATP-dependent RNA helicase DeaD